MALVLSLKNGDDFWVAGRKVVVSNVVNANLLELTDDAGDKHKITDAEMTEIMPDVFVSAAGYFKFGAVRIALDAPRTIQIMRGDRYRAQKGRRHGVS